MKSDYITRAKKFIEQIDFYMSGCKTVRDYEWGVADFLDHYKNRKVEVQSGISRVALITSDYVVKIDYAKNSQFGNCEDEVEMYEQAVADGMSHLLAPITRYLYGGHYYYIMPRVTGIGTWRYEFDDYCEGDDYQWVTSNVWDLHQWNFGRWHKRLVLIDYACRR